MRPELKAIKKAISEKIKKHFPDKLSFSFNKKVESIFLSDLSSEERQYISLFSKEVELSAKDSASSFVIDFIHYDIQSRTFEFSFRIRNKLNTFPESEGKNKPIAVELSRKREYAFKSGKYFNFNQFLSALDAMLAKKAQIEKKALDLEALLGEKPGYVTISHGYRSGANYSQVPIASLSKKLFSNYIKRKWKNKTIRHRHEQIFKFNSAALYYSSYYILDLKNRNLFGKLNPKGYPNYYKREKAEKLEKVARKVANDSIIDYLENAA